MQTVLTNAKMILENEVVTGTIAFDAQGNLKNPSFTVYQVKANQWQPVSVAGGKQ